MAVVRACGMTIEISLRTLVPADALTFGMWQADREYAAHAGWKCVDSPETDLEWWRETIAGRDPLLTRLMAEADGEPIGFVDLYGDDPHSRELGYSVAPADQWGKGLGLAVARAGVQFGFDVMGLDRIWAEAVAANEPSVRILERLGFQFTGRGDDESFLGTDSYYLQYERLRPLADTKDV